jgi:hypothetical protein
MTQNNMDKEDAAEAEGIKVVPFGEEGLAQWREQLKSSLGMRELTRLLLAGVDPQEAYKQAMAVDAEAAAQDAKDRGKAAE